MDALLRLQVRADAEPVGHRRHLVGAEVEGQLREDGVVGGEGRRRDRHGAEVVVAVGGDLPRLAQRVGLVGEGARRVGRRVRIDTLGDRRRQHERLERRAGLPAPLRREVELVPALARRHRRHRADRAVRRVDRDDRSGRVVGVGQRPEDRVPRRPAGSGGRRSCRRAARRSARCSRRTARSAAGGRS